MITEHLIDKLRAGKPLIAGTVTLVPIERIFVHSGGNNAGFWLSALKEAYAIVICDANGIRTLNTAAEEIRLDHLIQTVPDLDAMLASLAH